MSELQDVVLLVEDDPDDTHFMRRAFRQASIEATLTVAEDGDKAIEYLTNAEQGDGAMIPVLILLDLKLPRRSGFEVLDWIKSREGLRRIPVVVLTASKTGMDIKRAYDLGANSYLVKPVRSDALLAMASQIDAYWLSLNQRAVLPRNPI